MLDHLLVIGCVGLACAAWALLQLWARKIDPRAKTIFEGGCDGSGNCGGGGGAHCKGRAGGCTR